MSYYGADAEYALHTVLNLARAEDAIAPSARDLADFQKLPLAFVRKLLTRLEKAGLVTATEGYRGGWRLAKQPGDISVLDVVKALKDNDPLFECREIRARCELWTDGKPPSTAVSGVCEIHAVMLSAEARMQQELDRHSIGDLLGRLNNKTTRASGQAVQAWFDQRYDARKSSGKGKPT